MIITSCYQAQRRDVPRKEQFCETGARGRLERTRTVGVVRQVEDYWIYYCACRHREDLPGYRLCQS